MLSSTYPIANVYCKCSSGVYLAFVPISADCRQALEENIELVLAPNKRKRGSACLPRFEVEAPGLASKPHHIDPVSKTLDESPCSYHLSSESAHLTLQGTEAGPCP